MLSKQADQSQPTAHNSSPAEAGIDQAKVANNSVILNKHALLLIQAHPFIQAFQNAPSVLYCKPSTYPPLWIPGHRQSTL